MTKDKLLERIKQLETEREQVKATLLAYEGALQDCQYWLSTLEQKEEVNGGDSNSSSNN